MYTDKIERAVELAAICHRNQYRKNPKRKIPYISHPIAVGLMLIKYGYPEEVVTAGILHDVVEDTALSLNELEEEFGIEVASLVEEVSELDKSLSWERRKNRYFERLKGASREAKAISCCDKIHNMRSIIRSVEEGGNIWKKLKRGKEAQLDKFRQLLIIYEESLNSAMVEAYKSVLKRLKMV
ncbi:MAG: phosphohydrolase [Spirochaetes bacterium]|nr:MAG: phosphohydrolase [Spirochaetota bacterium]